MQKRETPLIAVCIAMLFLLLSACSSTANSQHNTSQITRSQPAALAETSPAELCPQPEPVACEPVVDLAAEAALRKLVLGNDWHKERRYGAAMEAYESVLVSG